MRNYYSNYELDFYISFIAELIKDYNEKINMLIALQDEFNDELKSRGNE